MDKIATNDNLLEELDLKAYKDEVYTKSEVDEAIEKGGKVKKVENKEPDASGNVNLGLSTVAFSGKYSDLSGLPDLSGSGSGGNVYELQKVDFTVEDWIEVDGKYRLGTSVRDIIDVYAKVGESYQKAFVEVYRDITSSLYSPVAFEGFYQYGTNLIGVTDKNGRDIVDTYATKVELEDKLDKSGGTLSGDLRVGGYILSNGQDFLVFGNSGDGVNFNNDTGIAIPNENNQGSTSMYIRAKQNDGTYKDLLLEKNGELKWDGKLIATSKNLRDMFTIVDLYQNVSDGDQIYAPNVNGYTFLCWLQPASNGWIGQVYCNGALDNPTSVYGFANQGWGINNSSVRFVALYVKDS